MVFLRRCAWPSPKGVRFLSSSVHRVFPTSTMDLVDMERTVSPGISSTWQYVVERDFCPAKARQPIGEAREDSDVTLWSKLTASKSKIRKKVQVVSRELDLIEASEQHGAYDRILLLVKHCDHSVSGGAYTEPSLTDEGAGQALSLARRISTFCNDETNLQPELMLVAPLRRSIQTALLSFPQFSPHTVRAVPWICHPSTTVDNFDVHDLLQLQTDYTGLDYSLCYSELESTGHSKMTSTEDLLHRADKMLGWIHSNDKKVIVVSSEATWLKAFGCAANYSRASSTFRDGELRVIGLNFI